MRVANYTTKLQLKITFFVTQIIDFWRLPLADKGLLYNLLIHLLSFRSTIKPSSVVW